MMPPCALHRLWRVLILELGVDGAGNREGYRGKEQPKDILLNFFVLVECDYAALLLTMAFDYGGGKNSGLSCPSESLQLLSFLFRDG